MSGQRRENSAHGTCWRCGDSGLIAQGLPSEGPIACPCVDRSAMYRTWPCGSPPADGQRQRYPGRFEYHLRTNYPEFKAETVLHMFAGSCEWGTSTDKRAETGADIVAPFDAIPSEHDGAFTAVLADPPYADHYQGEWGGELPKPKHILREAVRLVKPGGLIGILHIIIIPAYKEYGVERIGIHPILAGPNNAVRVFNVFRTSTDRERRESGVLVTGGTDGTAEVER